MNYALIEDGVVTNIIWLYERNEIDFPNAVKLGDRMVEIGDTYEDGVFYRNGEEVLTALEAASYALVQYEAAMQVLGVETAETVTEE